MSDTFTIQLREEQLRRLIMTQENHIEHLEEMLQKFSDSPVQSTTVDHIHKSLREARSVLEELNEGLNNV